MTKRTPKPLSWYREVYIKDGYRCVYCGRNMLADFDAWMSLDVDHIIPISKGGDDSLENRVTSCHVCNSLKGQYLPDNHSGMAVEDILDAARKNVLQKRAEWQRKFVPAIREFRQAKPNSDEE